MLSDRCALTRTTEACSGRRPMSCRPGSSSSYSRDSRRSSRSTRPTSTRPAAGCPAPTRSSPRSAMPTRCCSPPPNTTARFPACSRTRSTGPRVRRRRPRRSRGKPVAVIGASTGSFGAVWAQAELRKALGLAGARVLDHELAVPTAHEAFHADGRLLRGGSKRDCEKSSPTSPKRWRGARARGDGGRLKRNVMSSGGGAEDRPSARLWWKRPGQPEHLARGQRLPLAQKRCHARDGLGDGVVVYSGQGFRSGSFA